MKKSILLSLLLAFSFLSFSSCSGDDDSSSSNPTSQKLIGKWGTISNNETYLRFKFRNDNKVEYYVYMQNEPELEEVGSWSLNGNILKMIFSEGVELIFEQEVVYLDENTMQFIEIPGSEYEAWADTYIRLE